MADTSNSIEQTRQFFDSLEASSAGASGSSGLSTATLLRQRSRAQQLIVRTWRADALPRAVHTAMQINDHGVIVDMINLLNRRRYAYHKCMTVLVFSALYTLDVCVPVLGRLAQLLSARHADAYIECARRCLLAVKAGSVGRMIRDSHVPQSSIGVDVMSDERWVREIGNT